MPDLSPIVALALERLKREILQMKRGRSNKRDKPHKLLMLLAVIDLAEQDGLKDNRIYFDERLVKRFADYFHLISKDDDWCQPAPPFFHLRSASFWRHKPKPGREQAYAMLKTSGGGTKRIKDNIEYAYLTPQALLVFNDPVARQELRKFISSNINPRNITRREASFGNAAAEEEIDVANRLGMVFHESFPMSRQALHIVLSRFDEYAEKTDLTSAKKRMALLRGVTHLGTNYIKSMPRYGIGTGLLNSHYRLTAFGKTARKYDPLLSKNATLWLMHYFMSSPRGPGPAYWHELVKTRFRTGNEFEHTALCDQIREFVETSENKKLADRSIETSVTVFLGTYTKSEGLGDIGLLEQSDDGHYCVLEPDPPSVWAFGIALLDYWQANFGNRVTINLEELYADHSLGGIFQMAPGRINRYLQTLESHGYVEVYRISPPYQVVLLRQDTGPMWDKLYAFDGDDPYF